MANQSVHLFADFEDAGVDLRGVFALVRVSCGHTEDQLSGCSCNYANCRLIRVCSIIQFLNAL